jgi:eukaryotic-like serine/threonine-protein kinase
MGRSSTELGTERAGVIAGRYTLVSEVGRGGMGVVWRGIDEVLDREVALKRVGMSPGGVSPDLARAEREARLLASLNHPNVVAVFDLVNDGDEQWLIMEYVDNRTLAQLVRERGPLSPDEAARLLQQAASALAVAHKAGIVHRDVKPSNILVTPDGRVKLSDFGIARAHSDATLTQTGLMSGSPAYLSPEVASGDSASAASDVWALGATLYHALTGRPPFEVGDNVMGALYQIVHSDPPRPENAGWLLPLLEATMTKDPAARWSMAQVRDFLAKGGGTAAAPSGRAPDTGESTVLLPALAPLGAPTEDSTEDSSGDSTGSSSRTTPRWLLPVLLVGALVLLVGLGLLAISPGDGERPDTAGDETEQTGSPSPTESEEEATDEPSESPEETPEASAEEMEAFVGDYLSTVTSDPDTSWTWLTPEFQEQSGGIDDYKGFWSTVQSAELQSVEADPDSMTVNYTVRYSKTNGSVTTEDVSLGLVQQGDRYLIASEG